MDVQPCAHGRIEGGLTCFQQFALAHAVRLTSNSYEKNCHRPVRHAHRTAGPHRTDKNKQWHKRTALQVPQMPRAPVTWSWWIRIYSNGRWVRFESAALCWPDCQVSLAGPEGTPSLGRRTKQTRDFCNTCPRYKGGKFRFLLWPSNLVLSDKEPVPIWMLAGMLLACNCHARFPLDFPHRTPRIKCLTPMQPGCSWLSFLSVCAPNILC